MVLLTVRINAMKGTDHGAKLTRVLGRIIHGQRCSDRDRTKPKVELSSDIRTLHARPNLCEPSDLALWKPDVTSPPRASDESTLDDTTPSDTEDYVSLRSFAPDDKKSEAEISTTNESQLPDGRSSTSSPGLEAGAGSTLETFALPDKGGFRTQTSY